MGILLILTVRVDCDDRLSLQFLDWFLVITEFYYNSWIGLHMFRFVPSGCFESRVESVLFAKKPEQVLEFVEFHVEVDFDHDFEHIKHFFASLCEIGEDEGVASVGLGGGRGGV